jgi:hypothetical protein
MPILSCGRLASPVCVGYGTPASWPFFDEVGSSGLVGQICPGGALRRLHRDWPACYEVAQPVAASRDCWNSRRLRVRFLSCSDDF